MTLTSSTGAPSSVRAPLPVRFAAGLLVLLAAVSSFGVVMFSFFWGDSGLGAGAVFAAVALTAAVTAVAAVPSLLRGQPAGWAVTTGWATAYTYWSVYKVFAEGEFQSAGFLVAAIVLLTLLLTPRARSHAGVSA